MGEAVSAKLEGLVDRIEPMLTEIPLTLAPPTLDDSVSDLDRLNRGLKQSGCDVERLNVGIRVLRQLSDAVRKEDWNVTVFPATAGSWMPSPRRFFCPTPT